MPQIEAVLFDMDGVIADTEPLHVAAEQQTCRDYDFAIDTNQWGGFKGKTAEAIFRYLIDNYGDPKQHAIEELVAYKTDLFLNLADQRLHAIEGVLDFIHWTRQTYSKVGLVTSSNQRIQRCITGKLNIDTIFDVVITGDAVSHGKPHPEPYLTAHNALNIVADQAVVIEDSANGIISARTAGSYVLAVTTSHPAAVLKHSEPNFISENYLDARRQLEQFSNES